MAGHNRYTVLLDANVLYSVAISDALMEVAATGIYAAKWSKAIDDEWVGNLAKNKKRAEADFHTRRDSMHDACPDWEVPEEGWRLIEPCLSLPDVNDRHVLAAEHVIGATANVFNQTGKRLSKPKSFFFVYEFRVPISVVKHFFTVRADYRNKILYANDGGTFFMGDKQSELVRDAFSPSLRLLLWVLATLLTNQPSAKQWSVVSQFISLYRMVLSEAKLIGGFAKILLRSSS